MHTHVQTQGHAQTYLHANAHMQSHIPSVEVCIGHYQLLMDLLIMELEMLIVMLIG